MSPESPSPTPHEHAPPPPTAKIEVLETGEATRPRNKEHPNEDAFLAVPDRGFFAVFDGMGGHAAGEVASGLARDYCLKKLRGASPALSGNEIKGMVKSANQTIYETSKSDPDLKGMGTTATITQIQNLESGKKRAIIAQVGDSRVYVKRAGGGLEQVTIDDSWMRNFLETTVRSNEIIEKQLKLSRITSREELSEEEQKFWAYRNWITNALGEEGCEPTIYTVELNAGDIIILTTDGIHDVLTDAEIEEIAAGSGSTQSKAESLVQTAFQKTEQGVFRAKEKGDDATALVIKL